VKDYGQFFWLSKKLWQAGISQFFMGAPAKDICKAGSYSYG
jgi:hypothetical protein